MNIEIACREVQQKGPSTYRIRYQDGKTETKRLFSNPGTFLLCEMLPRKRKKGKIINSSLINTMTAIEKMPEKKSASRNEPSFDAFRHNLVKVYRYTLASGLWPSTCKGAKAMTETPDDKLRALFDLFENHWEKTGEGKTYKDFSEWYSAVEKAASELGGGCFSVDELDNLRKPCAIKSIPFPKKDRDSGLIRTAIQNVIKNRSPHSGMPVEQSYIGLSWRSPRYDHDARVRWENGKDEPCGYYSEEYHNCGNGYYWILLDHQHAMFVEKD